MGTVPITLTTTDGVLTLENGRVTFVTRRGTQFDHPVGELHSVAPSARVGFHVWHRDRCYKFVPGHEIVTGLSTGSDVVDLAAGMGQVARAAKADARMQAKRDHWVAVLQPLVGTAPLDVTVRRPWATWAVMLVITAIALALMALITAVVVLAG